MRTCYLLVFNLFLCFVATGQTVVSERIADLIPANYEIEGDAILQELDNGTLQFGLTDDFNTPWGPDVRVFLSNSETMDGAVEIINLTEVNHFQGELTIDLPDEIQIEDYQFVLFYCVRFQLSWATGTLGEVQNIGNNFDCLGSTVTSNNGPNTLDICPTDGVDDIIELRNNLMEVPEGGHYAYLLTDANEILQEVILDSVYNFEGSTPGTQRVYGIHFDGTLNAMIGVHRMQTTASACYTHSSIDTFLTITKMACVTPFDCMASTTSSTNGTSIIDICPTDGTDDIITLSNSLLETSGENYAYLLTDSNEVLQEVILAGSYNFEGSSLSEQRIYGIHYDGALNAMIGANRMQTTATECHIHSAPEDFLTITKSACLMPFECMPSATATEAWAAEVNICPSDGEADVIALRNNLFVTPGANYAYLLTDTNEILQEIILDSIYNFEGSPSATQRVYGISYDGELNAVVGANRMQTTATNCYTHSESTLFLTVLKTMCSEDFNCQESATATEDWVGQISICPSDGMNDLIELRNSLFESPGTHYAYLITDKDEILQMVTMDSIHNFENSTDEEQRVYGISFDGDLEPMIGFPRTQTTATGCFMHSDSDFFLTIEKTSCTTTSTLDTELAQQINIYPSPTSGILNIKLPAEFSPKQIMVYNALGIQLKTQPIHTPKALFEFDLTEFTNGNYWIRIEDDTRFITRAVTIAR